MAAGQTDPVSLVTKRPSELLVAHGCNRLADVERVAIGRLRLDHHLDALRVHRARPLDHQLASEEARRPPPSPGRQLADDAVIGSDGVERDASHPQ